MSTPLKTASVPALERGLAILEVVARSRNGLTFSQIARGLDFPKSSIHSLLLTFVREGYLHRSEASGRYMCGMKLIRIASAALEGIALRDQTAPVLRRLMESTGLTVHMAILERNEAALIAKVEPPGVHRVATWVGKRIDVHCTSLGKCLIANLPVADLERLISEHGLLRHNENTIASLPKLKQELDRVRCQGYAVDDEEEELGMRCIGVPVFDLDGRVISAISVSGKTDQIHQGNYGEFRALLLDAARQISAQVMASAG
jgi:DNA-binding IclR family transcriptional regulator